MRTIYEPKGRALEYSPWALNLYDGCDHDCAYCYVRKMMGKWKKKWSDISTPRPGVVWATECYLRSHPWKGKGQVQLSFCGDPYCRAEEEERTTRAILETLLDHKVPVSILTKGGGRCLRDLDLFKKFGPNIKVGATLTFTNRKQSLKVEPGAADPKERMLVLRELKKAGVEIWASFEPVIDPNQSLSIMRDTHNLIDSVKIGKINYDWAAEHSVDWAAFLNTATTIYSGSRMRWYVKKDLRDLCPQIKLPVTATDPEYHHIKKWEE